MKILIFGLPGSGKSTLADAVVERILFVHKTAIHLDADIVRAINNDWDFSPGGRLRQAARMSNLADKAGTDFVIADFVAPTKELRGVFGADYTVWVDTIEAGRYEDTNRIFEKPAEGEYDLRVTFQNADLWSKIVVGGFL